MRKGIMAAALLLAVGCQSPESRTESTSESVNKVNENGVTNSPPGGSTDTSGGMKMDKSGKDSINMGAPHQGDSMPK